MHSNWGSLRSHSWVAHRMGLTLWQNCFFFITQSILLRLDLPLHMSDTNIYRSIISHLDGTKWRECGWPHARMRLGGIFGICWLIEHCTKCSMEFLAKQKWCLAILHDSHPIHTQNPVVSQIWTMRKSNNHLSIHKKHQNKRKCWTIIKLNVLLRTDYQAMVMLRSRHTNAGLYSTNSVPHTDPTI